MNENPVRMGGRALVAGVLMFTVVGLGWLFWARGRAMNQPIPGVALLPFKAEPPEFGYFGDGLTIELTNALSKVEKLRVVSWNSAAQFRGKAGNLKELHDRLQAGAVVNGAVLKRGDRLLITANLIDTNGGETIWSETYDRPEREIFKIQEEIAKSIVYSLKVPLRVDPQRILVPVRTQSVEACQDYLRARAALGAFSLDGLARSSEFARKAIIEDPKFAPAYALLAANIGLFGSSFHKAKELARKTIEMDPSSVEAHAALGLALGMGEFDWKGARTELERAIQWSPGSADAHASMALGYLLPTGDPDGAEFEASKALELDPLSFFANRVAAEVFLARGKYGEAIDRFRVALAISAEFQEVRREYAAARRAAGEPVGVDGAFNEACAKAAAGDLDAAFASLDEVVEHRDREVVFVKSDIRLTNLRKDPRFGALLKRLKL